MASVHPTSGLPSTTVSVSGSGFGRQEAVDIYFDTGDGALAATDSTGSFSGMKISVPASVALGTHWVTAVGRRTGRPAQTLFVVGTNRAQFGFIPRHTRYNPVENMLGPSNAAELDSAWSYTAGDVTIYSSPAVANGVRYTGAGHNVYALDASTGQELWSYNNGGGYSSPAVANGEVYIGAGHHKVYAFALAANRANQAAARPKASRLEPNRSLRLSKGVS